MSKLLTFYLIKQFILFFPCPIFFVMGLISFFGASPICGTYTNEMALMWFLMSLAHSKAWIDILYKKMLIKNKEALW